MTQDDALSILKTGANVFLTGEPGSGKTHTINQYVSWLRERGIEPAITASTGIAATHIGGYTIHSWSGIGIKQDLTEEDLDRMAQNERLVRRARLAHVLIIDEVSMLSAATLSAADAACRSLRSSHLPFGGLQVVLVGDFFQLPPVVRRDESYDDASQLLPEEDQRSLFAFASPAWRALNPITCYLSEQHRQEDGAFLEILTAIRNGSVTKAHRTLLLSRKADMAEDGVTELYSHNANVDRVNSHALGKISGDVRRFTMERNGPDGLVTQLIRGCLSPEVLELKEGARVMFTKNNFQQKYVNGTTGTVIDFDSYTGHPIVETRSGEHITAAPMEWAVEGSTGSALARITQIPLRLAWAITVHKSQGMSLDAAHMDLSEAFEYGQGYVALSRVRTLKGLSIAGMNERALMVHPEIAAADELFREQSDAAEETFGEMKKAELKALQKNFVRACGGRETERKKR